MTEKFEPSEELIALVREKLVPLVGETRSLYIAAQGLATELKREGIECRASDLTQLAFKLTKA